MAEQIKKISDAKARKEVWLKRHAALKQEFSSLRAHCRLLQQNIQPRRGRNLANDNEPPDKGDRRNANIIDSTGRLGLRTLRSGMVSGVTSRFRRWFRFSCWDKDLAQWGPVRKWLEQAENLAYEVLERSGAYDTFSINFESLGLFGTGAFGMFESDRSVVHYRPLSLGTYWFTVDAEGRPNGVYIQSAPTVEQVVEQFGLDKCSKTVRDSYIGLEVTRRVNVLWVIEPNDRRMPGRHDKLNRPFKSVRFEMDEGDDLILEESGFFELPVIVSRWDIEGEDKWGRSPGMDALGDILGGKRIYKDMLRLLQYRANPPMGAPEELASKPSSLLPGHYTYYAQGAGIGKVEPLYTVDGRIDDLREEIGMHNYRIREAFYADLFKMLGDLDRQGATVQRTAREVAERHEEKLTLLGPVLDRLITEMVRPTILTQHSRCRRANMLPPPPQELIDAGLKIDVVSALAEAHRLATAGTVERFMEFGGSIGQMVPEALDVIDIDQVMRQYGELIHVPVDIIREKPEVDELRMKRAEAQRAAEQMAQANEMAKATKDLSQAKLEQGSVLDQLMASAGADAGGMM